MLSVVFCPDQSSLIFTVKLKEFYIGKPKIYGFSSGELGTLVAEDVSFGVDDVQVSFSFSAVNAF